MPVMAKTRIGFSPDSTAPSRRRAPRDRLIPDRGDRTPVDAIDGIMACRQFKILLGFNVIFNFMCIVI